MKRCLTVFLALLMLLPLFGCGKKDTPPKAPVNFYYPVDPKYRTEDARVIQAELRESAGCENSLLAFTDRYVKGPKSETLVSVFPDDCYPVSVYKREHVVTVYMSPGFSKLDGIDLTMACACLSATLMDYTKTDTVNICVKDIKLDGQRTITMTKDSFSLFDDRFVEETNPDEK